MRLRATMKINATAAQLATSGPSSLTLDSQNPVTATTTITRMQSIPALRIARSGSRLCLVRAGSYHAESRAGRAIKVQNL